MSLENQIQQWISIDNQLRIANKRIQELRAKRNIITNEIVTNNNNIDANKITTIDGHLKIVNTSISEPLTFAYLNKSLKEIIKNEDQVKIIIDHIKNRRAVNRTTEIKRIFN